MTFVPRRNKKNGFQDWCRPEEKCSAYKGEGWNDIRKGSNDPNTEEKDKNIDYTLLFIMCIWNLSNVGANRVEQTTTRQKKGTMTSKRVTLPIEHSLQSASAHCWLS
jgi:hypothetical protein